MVRSWVQDLAENKERGPDKLELMVAKLYGHSIY